MQGLIKYRLNVTPAALTAMEEAIEQKRFRYRASRLTALGFGSPIEIEKAVNLAMKTCLEGGISVEAHFKEIFITCLTERNIQRDWMLSELACKLVALNGEHNNPAVRRSRLEVVLLWK